VEPATAEGPIVPQPETADGPGTAEEAGTGDTASLAADPEQAAPAIPDAEPVTVTTVTAPEASSAPGEVDESPAAEPVHPVARPRRRRAASRPAGPPA
jgi:ribonuclease E